MSTNEYRAVGVFYAIHREDGKVIVYLYGDRESNITNLVREAVDSHNDMPLMGLITVDETDMDANFKALGEEKE